jgi:hypothetical protein
MSAAYTLNNETGIVLSKGNAGWIVQRFVFKTLCSQFMGILNNTENEMFSCPWLVWTELMTDNHALGNNTMLFD